MPENESGNTCTGFSSLGVSHDCWLQHLWPYDWCPFDRRWHCRGNKFKVFSDVVHLSWSVTGIRMWPSHGARRCAPGRRVIGQDTTHVVSPLHFGGLGGNGRHVVIYPLILWYYLLHLVYTVHILLQLTTYHSACAVVSKTLLHFKTFLSYILWRSINDTTHIFNINISLTLRPHFLAEQVHLHLHK